VSDRLAALLFDLDGTLLDTAPDLARALNRLRAEHDLPPLPYAPIRAQVSHGSVALIGLAFDCAVNSLEFQERRQRLLEFYAEDIACESQLFDGMAQVLETLEASGRPWGIVTNKPAWLTNLLLRALGLDKRAACVVSGDTVAHAKPHPAPLLHAAEQLGVAPAACLYVGDAERDVAAAHAAGMPVVVALYGYIDAHENPHTWAAAAAIDAPLDLLAWL